MNLRSSCEKQFACSSRSEAPEATCGSRNSQGHLVGDLQSVAFEGDHLAWVIGQNAQRGEAEVGQNLRADAALVLQKTLTGGSVSISPRLW